MLLPMHGLVVWLVFEAMVCVDCHIAALGMAEGLVLMGNLCVEQMKELGEISCCSVKKTTRLTN